MGESSFSLQQVSLLGDYFQTDPYIIIYSMIFAARKHQVSPIVSPVFFLTLVLWYKKRCFVQGHERIEGWLPCMLARSRWRSWVWGLFFDAENEDDDCWLMIIVDVTKLWWDWIIYNSWYDIWLEWCWSSGFRFFFSRPEMGLRLMTVLVKKSLR